MDTFRQILTQLNWIDILVIVTIITASYKGSKAGFSAEIFKLTGLILSIYLSLHYFSQASDLLTQYVPVIGGDICRFLLLLDNRRPDLSCDNHPARGLHQVCQGRGHGSLRPLGRAGSGSG